MKNAGEDQRDEREGEESDAEAGEGEARYFEDAHEDLREHQQGVQHQQRGLRLGALLRCASGSVGVDDGGIFPGRVGGMRVIRVHGPAPPLQAEDVEEEEEREEVEPGAERDEDRVDEAGG